MGSILGSGRSPGEGNGNPLQYSWQNDSKDKGALWAPDHGVARVRHDLATTPPSPPHPVLSDGENGLLCLNCASTIFYCRHLLLLISGSLEFWYVLDRQWV